MKKLLLHKQRGMNQIITAIGVFGFLLIFITVVIITCFSEFSNVKQRQALYMTTREYLLKMETRGYLTAADKADLLYDLGENGLTEVSLTGTTLAEVPYGETICLAVSGKLTENKAIGSWTDTRAGTEESIYSDRLYSTAKH